MDGLALVGNLESLRVFGICNFEPSRQPLLSIAPHLNDAAVDAPAQRRLDQTTIQTANARSTKTTRVGSTREASKRNHNNEKQPQQDNTSSSIKISNKNKQA